MESRPANAKGTSRKRMRPAAQVANAPSGQAGERAEIKWRKDFLRKIGYKL